MNGDLIACARHRIYDLKVKADKEQITHILFVIHLPQQVANSSFVGFQGNPWVSSHIDDLRPTTDKVVSASEAIGLTISELFLGRKKSEVVPLHQQQEEAEYGALDNRTDPDAEDDFNGASASFEGLPDRMGEARGDGEEMAIDPENEVERDFSHAESQSEDLSQDEGVEAEGMETEGGAARQPPTQLQVIDIEDDDLEFDDTSEQKEEEMRIVRQAIEQNNQRSTMTAPGSMQLSPTSVRVAFAPQPEEVFVSTEIQQSAIRNRSPLYCRLYGCIQAAASRVKDIAVKRCTKRVEILIRIIPKDPPKEVG